MNRRIESNDIIVKKIKKAKPTKVILVDDDDNEQEVKVVKKPHPTKVVYIEQEDEPEVKVVKKPHPTKVVYIEQDDEPQVKVVKKPHPTKVVYIQQDDEPQVQSSPKTVTNDQNIDQKVQEVQPQQQVVQPQVVNQEAQKQQVQAVKPKQGKARKFWNVFLPVIGILAIGAGTTGAVLGFSQSCAKIYETSAPHKINITLSADAGWTFTCDKTEAKKGDMVIFTVSPTATASTKTPKAIDINGARYNLVKNDKTNVYSVVVIISFVEEMNARVIFE